MKIIHHTFKFENKKTTPPFQNQNDPSLYYCKACSSYTNDFYQSAIRAKHKRCRLCHKIAMQKHQAKRHPPKRNQIEILVKKLQRNFQYRGMKHLSKCVKETDIMSMLTNSSIDEKDWPKIKTISPQFDEASGLWKFSVKFKIPFDRTSSVYNQTKTI